MRQRMSLVDGKQVEDAVIRVTRTMSVAWPDELSHLDLNASPKNRTVQTPSVSTAQYRYSRSTAVVRRRP